MSETDKTVPTLYLYALLENKSVISHQTARARIKHSLILYDHYVTAVKDQTPRFVRYINLNFVGSVECCVKFNGTHVIH